MMHNVVSLSELDELTLEEQKKVTTKASTIRAPPTSLPDIPASPDTNRRQSTPNIGSKGAKENRILHRKIQRKAHFGVCFDVDGVLARGTDPIDAAVHGFRKLMNDKREFIIPVVFVTNSLNRNIDKATQIGKWMNTHVSEQQMVQAQSPLEVFTKYHDKFCLLVGQGKIYDIAKELGFTDFCLVEDVVEAYPLLDMVDHENRKRVTAEGYVAKPLREIEAVILMGEPRHWESSLQLIVDILKTNGKPDHVPSDVPDEHIPVIACNMDLQFMERACMPRYGHGAYLLCLEALYTKCTGNPLRYTALVGKPSEITMRYAEHCLSREAKRIGIDEPLQRMYLIGDTPEVDIVGSNLYQRYIDKYRMRRCIHDIANRGDTCKECDLADPELPNSRQIPASADFSQQTVEEIQAILVCTGVYNPEVNTNVEGDMKSYRGHRDFQRISSLYQPSAIHPDVSAALDYILEQEQFWPHAT